MNRAHELIGKHLPEVKCEYSDFADGQAGGRYSTVHCC